MDNQPIKEFADANGMSFEKDVFPGCGGGELRKKINGSVFCVGFIVGYPHTQVYCRQLGKFSSLKKLLWVIGIKPAANYQNLAKFPATDFNAEQFLAIAQREFKSRQV